MSTAVAIVLFFGVTAYAVFAGADFGAGFWDLVAGGAERGKRPRALEVVACVCVRYKAHLGKTLEHDQRVVRPAALEIDDTAVISGETSYRLYLYDASPASVP